MSREGLVTMGKGTGERRTGAESDVNGWERLAGAASSFSPSSTLADFSTADPF